MTTGSNFLSEVETDTLGHIQLNLERFLVKWVFFVKKKTRVDYKVVIVVMGLVFLKFLITRLNLEISDTFALSDKR